MGRHWLGSFVFSPVLGCDADPVLGRGSRLELIELWLLPIGRGVGGG
jgi:hypothetical protein